MFEPNDVFESLVQDLVDHDFAVVDNFISHAVMLQLRHNLIQRLGDGRMAQAGVGRESSFQKNTDIRRDLISWIEEDQADVNEAVFHARLHSLIHYLNETCYTGITAMECHYAWYDTGSFYKKHKDRFTTDSRRKYSVVTYLNKNWMEEDGGELVLHLADGSKTIDPLGGRAVFFQSDKIEHEVLIALKPRMSIAGWMKS
jgi:SM-20-related protein